MIFGSINHARLYTPRREPRQHRWLQAHLAVRWGHPEAIHSERSAKSCASWKRVTRQARQCLGPTCPTHHCLLEASCLRNTFAAVRSIFLARTPGAESALQTLTSSTSGSNGEASPSASSMHSVRLRTKLGPAIVPNFVFHSLLRCGATQKITVV